MTDVHSPAPLGRTDVKVGRLGLGSAAIGGLYRPVDEQTARATVDTALELGVRYFDTAPQYGLGLGELRIGRALEGVPREGLTVSTKVGRLIRSRHTVPQGADVEAPPPQFPGVDPDLRIVWDLSRHGVLRSLDESRERLRMERIDVVYIHDPDGRMEIALDEAMPTLVELRAAGVVGAIGVGANTVDVLQRFVDHADVDVILLANRYTLLDQSALPRLLPACVARGVAVVIGGVMNSGLLADPRPGATYDYVEAPPALLAQAALLSEICARHGVSARAAAVRFVMAHPAVVSLLAGVRRRDHLIEYPGLMTAQVPGALWDELKDRGLLPRDAPTPGT